MTDEELAAAIASVPWEEPVIEHLPLRLKPTRLRVFPPTMSVPEQAPEELDALARALAGPPGEGEPLPP